VSISLSRRSFARLLGGTFAAASASRRSAAAILGAAPSPAPDAATHRFPQGFLWGSATASYQVEGAVKEGGRGPSIWDTFSHTSGKTHNGDTGDVADDFYHRYPEDIRLMRDLGLKTCRFSIAWPRIFPNGTGAPNQQGVDFYSRVVDALLEAGIEPYATLYHWDLPQALQDKGGWENRDTAKAFADYAGYITGKLSGRVRQIMTMNEIRTFTELGYGNGTHAPGLQVGRKRLAQVNHNAILGHGLSVAAIRAATKAGTKVGLADNATVTCPVFDSPEHIEAAHKAYRLLNAMYLTPIMEGAYPDLYLKYLGADAPTFTPEDMKAIGSPLDFVGLNVYQPTYVRADNSPGGFAVAQQPASYPHMFSPWLTIGPEALYWSPKLAHELWKVDTIYITENGASSSDVVAPDGHVYDTDRTMYLRNYITQLHRAVSEGIPVKGYFLWSLLDNYEWADGYEKRFGIVYVDFKTQKRIPKLSAEFYRRTIAENAVM
jgi:beta-glucosidase